MKLFINEVFDRLEGIKGRNEKIAFLRSNSSPALTKVLQGIFNEKYQFYRSDLPPYTPDDAPIGRNPTSIDRLSKEFYIWLRDYNIPYDKKERHLLINLEGMHVKDCRIIEMMFKKNASKLKGLTSKLVEEAFPGILD